MNPEERARVGFVPSMGDTRWAGRESSACWLGGALSMTRCIPCARECPGPRSPITDRL
jgi:hypothetical protein